MAKAILVRTVVFDESLYRGNGDVHRWVRGVTKEFGANAVVAAPKRTGRLAKQIKTFNRRVGPRQVEGAIRSTAPYTMYVLRGTTGPIMSDKGWAKRAKFPSGKSPKTGKYVTGWMRLRGPGPLYKWKVSGQSANNFLLKAWKTTARRHRALSQRIPDVIRHP
jgi:hypothetical protein